MAKRKGSNRTAMLLGGIAAGAIGGRMLPALFGAVIGSGRVRAGGDPFALLMDDHRKILSLLDEMASARVDSTARRGRLFLALKRKLAKHAMAEEDVVYPIVRNDSQGNERKHLYDEHAEMKILLYTIERQLMAGEDWNKAVVPLRDLIRRHVNEEETVIFPELRRRLSGDELPKVSGQISREEALVV
jgi:hemerythrin-like domain-containing protein